MTIPREVEEQLTQLETQAAYDEMNAERIDDADNPVGAKNLRDNAAKLRTQFEQLAAAMQRSASTSGRTRRLEFSNALWPGSLNES